MRFHSLPGSKRYPDHATEYAIVLVRIVDPDRQAVDDRRRFLPVEWYFTEPCDQWLPAVAFEACFETCAQPMWYLDLGLCLAAIFDIDERCLPARVLSMEVSMTQRVATANSSRPEGQTRAAPRSSYLRTSPIMGPATNPLIALSSQPAGLRLA